MGPPGPYQALVATWCPPEDRVGVEKTPGLGPGVSTGRIRLWERDVLDPDRLRVRFREVTRN